jgi:glycosyltransferase involved in cell wall biosynthesis
VERPALALVIPALNEERSLPRVLEGVREYGLAVVVDDGSDDGTARVAAGAGAVVVRHSSPRGYDAALDSGFAAAAAAGCEYVVTFDADGQHPAALVPKFLELLESGNDVVVGIRPTFARVSERVFGAYTRLRYGVRDPLCGMKGYSVRLYTDVGHFDCYRSIGTELLLAALRERRRVAQIPVPIVPREGKSGFGGALRGNWRIARALALGVVPRHPSLSQRARGSV